MITPQTKIHVSKHCVNMARICASKHCGIFSLDDRRTSQRQGGMNQNAGKEISGLPSDCHGPFDRIIRYDTPKVNEDGMIIIPRDVIRPKPKTWSEDYIAACLPYCPTFDKRCWNDDQKPILDHPLTQNTSSNRKSWGEFL